MLYLHINIKSFLSKEGYYRQDNPQILKSAGRDFVVSLAHVYIGTLLLEHAME